MTNADVIRNMTDEEMAVEFAFGDCYCCVADETPHVSCRECMMLWLKKEAKEE